MLTASIIKEKTSLLVAFSIFNSRCKSATAFPVLTWSSWVFSLSEVISYPPATECASVPPLTG
nr:MAG TPA: hypothetical protein [Caudoviricetes sp.]